MDMSGLFEGAIFNDKDETEIKHHLPTNHCNAQPYDKEMLLSSHLLQNHKNKLILDSLFCISHA